MNWLRLFSLRFYVILLLWLVPFLIYLSIGIVSVYQSGWLPIIAISLPPVWLLNWAVVKFWKGTNLKHSNLGKPLSAPEFWTEQDTHAIQIVEKYRQQVEEMDRSSIANPNRYVQDAQSLAQSLAEHYHGPSSKKAHSPLTVVEIISVLHLCVEDLEQWILENVPGSSVVTLGHMEKIPYAFKALDIGQSIFFLTSSIFNPAKLLSYPIWRKSGNATSAMQKDLINAFYQIYLRQIGFYLIEMYSGRLHGGSRKYRQQFGQLSKAIHATGGDISPFANMTDVSTTIAVMGQVKAGKSSLINALMKDKVSEVSVLPMTREVKRFDFHIEESEQVLTLLDTPGYEEADTSKRQRGEIQSALELADIVLLVMAANAPAREADVQMVREFKKFYATRPNLRPPPIIAVLTHIDLLRPVREWSPPYDWRNPQCEKETSMANAVAYVQELFGDSVSTYACVCTGETAVGDSSVADELVPQLVQHLSQGNSAAILKAFYRELGQKQLQTLLKQTIGLIKTVGRSVLK